MVFLAEQGRKLRNFAKTSFFAAALVYFAYHGVSGERGLLAMAKISKELEEIRTEHQEIQTDREKLQHRVNMMYSYSLDRDLLDEQARKILGHAHKDEVIFYHPNDSIH